MEPYCILVQAAPQEYFPDPEISQIPAAIITPEHLIRQTLLSIFSAVMVFINTVMISFR
jgi:hypothetical protein